MALESLGALLAPEEQTDLSHLTSVPMVFGAN